MSDYERLKVIRMKPTEEQLKKLLEKLAKYGCDLWSMEDVNGLAKFRRSPTEAPFIDYTIYRTYGEENGEFVKTRPLMQIEIEPVLELFRRVIPDVSADQLRVVDFCWYNCSEAPDYFDEEIDDPFYMKSVLDYLNNH